MNINNSNFPTVISLEALYLILSQINLKEDNLKKDMAKRIVEIVRGTGSLIQELREIDKIVVRTMKMLKSVMYFRLRQDFNIAESKKVQQRNL